MLAFPLLLLRGIKGEETERGREEGRPQRNEKFIPIKVEGERGKRRLAHRRVRRRKEER